MMYFSMYVYRIVKAFDSIVNALRTLLTNMSIVQRNLALKGERVSVLKILNTFADTFYFIA